MLRRDLQGMSLNKARSSRQGTDVAVGGAGFAGLALAIALRQALGDPFAVTVIDPTLAHAQSKDPRASAIASAATWRKANHLPIWLKTGISWMHWRLRQETSASICVPARWPALKMRATL